MRTFQRILYYLGLIITNPFFVLVVMSLNNDDSFLWFLFSLFTSGVYYSGWLYLRSTFFRKIDQEIMKYVK